MLILQFSGHFFEAQNSISHPKAMPISKNGRKFFYSSKKEKNRSNDSSILSPPAVGTHLKINGSTETPSLLNQQSPEQTLSKKVPAKSASNVPVDKEMKHFTDASCRQSRSSDQSSSQPASLPFTFQQYFSPPRATSAEAKNGNVFLQNNYLYHDQTYFQPRPRQHQELQWLASSQGDDPYLFPLLGHGNRSTDDSFDQSEHSATKLSQRLEFGDERAHAVSTISHVPLPTSTQNNHRAGLLHKQSDGGNERPTYGITEAQDKTTLSGFNPVSSNFHPAANSASSNIITTLQTKFAEKRIPGAIKKGVTSNQAAYELVASVKWTEFIRDLQNDGGRKQSAFVASPPGAHSTDDAVIHDKINHVNSELFSSSPFSSPLRLITQNVNENSETNNFNKSSATQTRPSRQTKAAVAPLTELIGSNALTSSPGRPAWHLIDDNYMTPTAFAPSAAVANKVSGRGESDQLRISAAPHQLSAASGVNGVSSVVHRGVNPLPFAQLAPGTSLDRPPASYLSVSEHPALRSRHRHAPGEEQRLRQFGDDDTATLALVEDAIKEFQLTGVTPLRVQPTESINSNVPKTSAPADVGRESAASTAHQLVPYRDGGSGTGKHAEVIVASSTVIKNLFTAGLRPEKPLALSIKRVGSMAVVETVNAVARAEAAMTMTSPHSLREEALMAKVLYHTVEKAYSDCVGDPAVKATSIGHNQLVPYSSTDRCPKTDERVGGPRRSPASTPLLQSDDALKGNAYQHTFRYKVADNIEMFVGSDIPLWSQGSIGESPVMTLRMVDLDKVEPENEGDRRNAPLHGPRTLFEQPKGALMPYSHKKGTKHGTELLSPATALDAWFDATLTSASSIALLTHRAGNVERYEFVSPAQVLERAGGLTQRVAPAERGGEYSSTLQTSAGAALQFTGTALRWIVQMCEEEGGTYLLVRHPAAQHASDNDDERMEFPELMLYKVASPSRDERSEYRPHVPKKDSVADRLEISDSVLLSTSASSTMAPDESLKQQRTLAILSVSVARHSLQQEGGADKKQHNTDVRRQARIVQDLRAAADTIALLHRSTRLLVELIRLDHEKQMIEATTSQMENALTDAFFLIPIALKKLHCLHREAHINIFSAPTSMSLLNEDGMDSSDEADFKAHELLKLLCGFRTDDSSAGEHESDSEAATVLRHSPMEWNILLLASLCSTEVFRAFVRSSDVNAAEAPEHMIPQSYLDVAASMIALTQDLVAGTVDPLLNNNCLQASCTRGQTEKMHHFIKLNDVGTKERVKLSSFQRVSRMEKRHIAWLTRCAGLLDIFARRLRPRYLDDEHFSPRGAPQKVDHHFHHCTVYHKTLLCSHELVGDIALLTALRPTLYSQLRAELASSSVVDTEYNEVLTSLLHPPIQNAKGTSKPPSALVPNKVLLDAFGPPAASLNDPISRDMEKEEKLHVFNATMKPRIAEFERLTFRALASYSAAQQQSTIQQKLFRHHNTNADSTNRTGDTSSQSEIKSTSDSAVKLTQCRLMGKLSILHHLVGRYYLTGRLPMEVSVTYSHIKKEDALETVQTVGFCKDGNDFPKWAVQSLIDEKLSRLTTNLSSIYYAYFHHGDVLPSSETVDEDGCHGAVCEITDKSQLNMTDPIFLTSLVERTKQAEYFCSNRNAPINRRVTKAREALGRAAVCLATHRGLWAELINQTELSVQPELKPDQLQQHINMTQQEQHQQDAAESDARFQPWWHRGVLLVAVHHFHNFSFTSPILDRENNAFLSSQEISRSCPGPVIVIFLPARIHIGTHGTVSRDQAILSLLRASEIQARSEKHATLSQALQAVSSAPRSGSAISAGLADSDTVMTDKESASAEGNEIEYKEKQDVNNNLCRKKQNVQDCNAETFARFSEEESQIWEDILRQAADYCDDNHDLSLSFQSQSIAFRALTMVGYLGRLCHSFRDTLTANEAVITSFPQQKTASVGTTCAQKLGSTTHAVLLSQIVPLVQLLLSTASDAFNTGKISEAPVVPCTLMIAAIIQARFAATTALLSCVTAALRQGYFRPEEDEGMCSVGAISNQKNTKSNKNVSEQKNQPTAQISKAEVKRRRRNCHLKWVASGCAAVTAAITNVFDAPTKVVLHNGPHPWDHQVVKHEFFIEIFLSFLATVLELDLFAAPSIDASRPDQSGTHGLTLTEQMVALGVELFSAAFCHWYKHPDGANQTPGWFRSRLNLWRPMKRLIVAIDRLFPVDPDVQQSQSVPSLSSLKADKTTGVPLELGELFALLSSISQRFTTSRNT